MVASKLFAERLRRTDRNNAIARLPPDASLWGHAGIILAGSDVPGAPRPERRQRLPRMLCAIDGPLWHCGSATKRRRFVPEIAQRCQQMVRPGLNDPSDTDYR